MEVSDLMELYRAAKGRFDAEEDFKTRSREAVTALQSGDPDSLEVRTPSRAAAPTSPLSFSSDASPSFHCGC